MKKKLLFSLLPIGVSAISGMAANQVNEKPNVLFILIDDLGYHQMGFNGSTYYETPNFDRLASESMKFTNAYAAAALSSPTRASIMSGKYPTRLKLTDWLNGYAAPASATLDIPAWTKNMEPTELRLPQLMQANGYRTSLIGKWHCSSYTTGFDEVFRFDGPQTSDECGGVDCHRVKEYTDSTLNFLRRNKDKPFFCYLSHNSIHTPEAESSSLISKYAQKAGSMNNGQLNPTQGAMIETLDKYTGILLDSLDRMGLTDNTIVMVFSDNGQHAPSQQVGVSPLRGAKCSFWEGGFKEPLLVKWKGKIVAGSLCDKQVISMDFLPTIAELCGINAPELAQLDGKSFAKNLTVNPELAIDRPYLCWHYPHYHPDAEFLGAIRKGDWKLIENFNQSLYFKSGGFELYNLNNDPKETTNLLESNPAKAAELYADLQNWREDTKAQMPGTKNKVYGVSHFQLHAPNTAVKAEKFETQSGLTQGLQYDGSGTYLSLSTGNELSYYVSITQAGNYKMKMLYKNSATSIALSSASFSNATINIAAVTNWSDVSSDNIYFNAGIHKITLKVLGSSLNLDKLSISNANTTLIHDGEAPLMGKNLNIRFETAETPAYQSIEGSTINQSILPQIVDNPDRSGLNPTEKCLYIKTKKDLTVSPKVPAWSSNHVTITLNEPLEITDNNRYLHILHRKGLVLNNWLVYASEDGTNFLEVTRGACPAGNTWFDIVSDIKTKFASIQKIRIYLDGNWAGTDDVRYYVPTDFYYDELAFTSNSQARTTITSALKEIEPSNYKIFPNPVKDNLRIEAENEIESVSIQNIYGNTVKSLYGLNTKSISINTDNIAAGIYLVRMNYFNGEKKVMRVIKN